MQTGIGVLIEVQILFVEENLPYPAKHRFEGTIITPAGEQVPFVTDKKPPKGDGRIRAVGRWSGKKVEVANFIKMNR